MMNRFLIECQWQWHWHVGSCWSNMSGLIDNAWNGSSWTNMKHRACLAFRAKASRTMPSWTLYGRITSRNWMVGRKPVVLAMGHPKLVKWGCWTTHMQTVLTKQAHKYFTQLRMGKLWWSLVPMSLMPLGKHLQNDAITIYTINLHRKVSPTTS